ncbi:class I SAM-dependent methyltransferase [Actinokineospora auranticolor]|uniref:Methyltransferase family protein n=1 Tax=Actinokineospora auranticolor TaxID=155976 RepID=A0A2S6H1C7_9PSEU|nr:class I SAM-dependent methyltransferase [Actinokineospora auranticolor]PPK71292.1 methyltransferase family protein [Actinokineospora auranticolor]
MSTQTSFSHTTADARGSRLTAREAFNGAVASSAIAAAFDLGLLRELADGPFVEVEEFAARHGVRVAPVRAIVAALAHLDAVSCMDTQVSRGPAFEDVWENKGYFLWLVGGYGRMLSEAGVLAAADPSTSVRDGGVIARAGKDYGAQFVDPRFDAVLDECEFTTAADLGCGSANRLIRLALARPAGRYLGVEVNPAAVEVARAAVRAAGVEDRVEIVHEDISRLAADRFAGYDLVFSFFLGHDLWPADDCVRALTGIRAAFPDARTFLLADTYRSERLTHPDTPIFTLGFEYTHAMMGQHIPSIEEWRTLFAKTPWNLTGFHPLDIAYSAIFELTTAPRLPHSRTAGSGSPA